MSLPIVVIHVNNNDYLLYCLAQAKQSNPQSDVILLGEASNDCYNFAVHEPIFDYIKEAHNFVKFYKHISANSFNFELFCFQRWFILKEFMRAKKLEKCVCIDSDVLLYADVTEEQKKFADRDLTLSAGTSPHCTFVNNFLVLENFCNFLIEMYANSAILERLQNNLYGIVSDMTAFEEFARREDVKIGELSAIIDGATYDLNINESEGFEMAGGVKNIYFVENKPFCRHLDLQRAIQFNILHFQGYQTKKLMKDYFRGESALLESRSFRRSLESLKESYINLNLNLREINLIVFPDWNASEDAICQDLARAIRAIATHPDRSHIALLIGPGYIADEDADMILCSVVMNLLIEDDLDVSEGPEISLVSGQMRKMEWGALLPWLDARLIVENEGTEAIATVGAENIPTCELESICLKRVVQSEQGTWKLQ